MTFRITSKKIYSDRPDIEKKVYEEIPVTKKEKGGCMTEKAMNEWARFERAKQLYESETNKN